ncbi:MAG TPA: anti-sigma factor [Thermoanaerobaculia bacterium]|nr:anti-sigma factor [Thermoanaerobaculia bacterium]
MAHSDRFEELAALQALGLPSPQEAAELSRHLAEGCSICEELIADYRSAAATLSVEAPPRTPSPELRGKILASLPGTPSLAFRREPSRPVPRAISRRESERGAGWWVAAAAAILAAVLIWDDARIRRQREDLRSRAGQLSAELSSARAEAARRDLRVRVLESDDVKVLYLGGKDPQPSARAKVFWSEKAKTGMILAGNLAALPPDKQYELWVFSEGKPVAAGVFDADPSGRALFESTHLPGLVAAQNFAVTIEPRGGVPQPTGPIVLVGTQS